MFLFIIIKNLNLCNSNRITNILDNYFIKCCNFYNLSSLNTGGAISINSTLELDLFIESSSFYFCNCIGSNIEVYGGGSIFFKSNGNSFLNKICGYYSYVTTIGKRCHFIILNINKNSLINYLTFSKCSSDSNFEVRDTLRVEKGDQKIKNLNSSFNNAYSQSSILIFNPNYYELLYSNFINNSCFEFMSIVFHSTN